MGDIALTNNRTSGELTVEDGDLVADNGLQTAVFISLFSGAKEKYWGNEFGDEPAEHYGGEFEPLLEGALIDNTSINLMGDAIQRDLEWMKEANLISEVQVSAHIVSMDEAQFRLILFKPNGDKQVLEFSSNWANV